MSIFAAISARKRTYPSFANLSPFSASLQWLLRASRALVRVHLRTRFTITLAVSPLDRAALP